MLDIKFIRENESLVREALVKRHYDFDLNRLLELDENRRALLQETENLRARQNKASEGLPAQAGFDESLRAELKSLKEELQKKEAELKKAEDEFEQLMLLVPNIPDPSVPEGKGEEDNIELRRWVPSSTLGVESLKTPSVFPGAKSHRGLVHDLELADFERGAKVSGFRGYFLKNEGVFLSFALWRFALDYMIEKGFTPFIAPALIKENIFVQTGKLPLFREDLYSAEDNLFLSPSAEVPMMGYHEDEILSEDELPKKYVAFSPCFRREAGSYGKDEKGLYRLHEFMKVEQIVICKAEHQESVRWHEELTRYSEEMLQALGLPYRVVINSTGDLPFGFVKMYDLEAWLPSENRYRETHSSSMVHDFQTRRLKIRYRAPDGKIRFAHSLNNTAIATPRILQSLLENHQQPDGSVKIPQALRKYLGQDVIKARNS